jgi:hypothetical protein
MVFDLHTPADAHRDVVNPLEEEWFLNASKFETKHETATATTLKPFGVGDNFILVGDTSGRYRDGRQSSSW